MIIFGITTLNDEDPAHKYMILEVLLMNEEPGRSPADARTSAFQNEGQYAPVSP